MKSIFLIFSSFIKFNFKILNQFKSSYIWTNEWCVFIVRKKKNPTLLSTSLV